MKQATRDRWGITRSFYLSSQTLTSLATDYSLLGKMSGQDHCLLLQYAWSALMDSRHLLYGTKVHLSLLMTVASQLNFYHRSTSLVITSPRCTFFWLMQLPVADIFLRCLLFLKIDFFFQTASVVDLYFEYFFNRKWNIPGASQNLVFPVIALLCHI